MIEVVVARGHRQARHLGVRAGGAAEGHEAGRWDSLGGRRSRRKGDGRGRPRRRTGPDGGGAGGRRCLRRRHLAGGGRAQPAPGHPPPGSTASSGRPASEPRRSSATTRCMVARTGLFGRDHCQLLGRGQRLLEDLRELAAVACRTMRWRSSRCITTRRRTLPRGRP